MAFESLYGGLMVVFKQVNLQVRKDPSLKTLKATN